jgi:DNA-binding NtrC family response regulator
MDDHLEQACRVHVLAVSPFESDHVGLAHIFGHTAWRLEGARSLREASVKLSEPRLTAHPPVILCEQTLHDGCWKDLFEMVQKLSTPHQFIVTSNHADDRLWAEVLNLGAYDVLQKPFRSQEVFRSVGLAWTEQRKPVARTPVGPAKMSAGAVA